MRATRIIAIMVAASLLLVNCGGGSGGSPAPTPAAMDPPAMNPPVIDPPAEPSITTQQVFTSLPAFAQPLAMVQTPADDSNWYVVERAGRVLRFANDPGEAGLRGIAFHPDFQTNGNVFLSSTRTGLVMQTNARQAP